MSVHCMLDLETLGTGHDAVIAQIGAVAFDPMVGPVPSREDGPDQGICWRPTFEVNVSVEDCQEYGLTIDASTVLFWLGQDRETVDAVFRELRSPLGEALMLFKAWYVNNKCVAPWSHGKEFDVKIIENAMRAVGMRRPPWKFRDVLDTRTAFWMANVEMPRSERRPHRALDDALHQARWVCQAVGKIREEWPTHQDGGGAS